MLLKDRTNRFVEFLNILNPTADSVKDVTNIKHDNNAIILEYVFVIIDLTDLNDSKEFDIIHEIIVTTKTSISKKNNICRFNDIDSEDTLSIYQHSTSFDRTNELHIRYATVYNDSITLRISTFKDRIRVYVCKIDEAKDDIVKLKKEKSDLLTKNDILISIKKDVSNALNTLVTLL